MSLGIYLLLIAPQDSEVATPDRVEQTEGNAAVVLDEALPAPQPDAAPTAAEVAPPKRQGAHAATLSGRVLDAGGSPLEGATVTWHALTRTHFESLYAWDAVERGTGLRETRSDAAGSFAFDEPPAGAHEGHTALWVTHPGSRAAAMLVGLDRPLPVTPIELRLEPGPSIRVRVEDASGRPMPGVRVDQCGIRTPPALLASPTWGAAHRAFFRSGTTDADGRLEQVISEFPATYTLIARAGAQRSQPWFSSIDGPADDVVLRMGPQFRAGGSVRWPSEIPTPTRGLVTVSGVTNAYQLVLSQARVAEDGTWGPLEVPMFGAVAYVFRLEGEGCGIEQRTIPAPEVGAVVQVDFAPQPGFDLPLEVVDDAGAPVGGASLVLTTGAGGDTIFVQGHTDGSGAALLRGIPPGFANLGVSATDHPPARVESISIGPGRAEPLRVELASSARLEGRVTHAGEAVEDFEIAWWTQALYSGQPPTVQRFEGAVDGRFVLEGLPRARLSLLAASNEHPRSEARELDLSAGAPEAIEIELPAPIAASGRIVDAFSGDAIAGAVVQQFTNSGAAFVHAWGAASIARADGSFDLPGLAPGDNRLTVQAAGYADRLVSVFAPDTTQMDLGPVPLFHGMELVLVHTPDDPRGSEGLRAALTAARQHPPQTFDADGTSIFQGVTPGRVVADLTWGDGSTEILVLDLPPAEQHIVEVGGGGSARLELSVAESILETLVDPWVGLRDRTPHGLRTRSAFLSPEGLVVFPCELGSRYSATLWSDGRAVTTRSLWIDEPDQRILFDISTREATLEVVDALGRPVPFAELHLYDQDGWTLSGSTGADGRGTFAGLPSAALAGAISPTHGMRFDVPVEPAPPSRPTRIELNADAELHLALTTADGPAAGIQVRAMGAADTYLVGYATTDDDGRATFANLAEGTYTVHVEHPGLFRRTVKVETSTRAQPAQLRVHPLGALQLTVKSGDGAPIAGAEIDLRHPDLPGTLRDWVAEGRVALEGGLRTDGQGRIYFDELPAGTVQWTVAGGPHAGVRGAAEIVPGGLAEGD